MKLLTIIILAYNSEPYINELLDCLAPQVTDEVEVLVIDDGSEVPFQTTYPWVKIHRQENHGVAYSRNVGLDMSRSEYFAYIDADDLVSDKYIDSILKTAKTDEFDFCYLSWRTMDGSSGVKLKSVNEKFPDYNLCCWNRVYRKSFVGDLRFNTNKSIGEDAEFVKKLNENGKKKSFISDYMYFYRTSTPDSLTKRFQEGRLNTKRIVYYFPIVRKNMTFLLDEIKDLNEVAEVVLMTNNNELPQLEKYATVTPPRKIHGTELRGYPTRLFNKVTPPIEAGVVIWTEKTYEIGGLETFIYNFCKQLSPYYDITVLYRVMDKAQMVRLSEYADLVQSDKNQKIKCDTLIINRITDKAPENIEYRQKIQMVHSCKWQNDLVIPHDNDKLIAVSNTVAKSYSDFGDDYEVINNLTCPKKIKRALILISATRTGTNEKGQKRMIALSNLMKGKGIPYVWFCFADYPMQNTNNIVFMKPTLDIAPYIMMADYLVQLSDHEGFCYSIVEAMELGTPVLATPLDVLSEIGFVDGKTGYTIPFDLTEEFDIEKIYNKQLKGSFEYKYNNEKRIKQWKTVLGKAEKKKVVDNSTEKMVNVKAILNYHDLELNRKVVKDEVISVRASRAYDLLQKRFVELMGDCE